MSKYNGKKINSKITTARLNRKSHKPEVVIVHSNSKLTDVKSKHEYRQLNQNHSDTTSLSDNNHTSKHTHSFPSKDAKLASHYSQYKHSVKHDEAASVSSANTVVDEMKSSRNGSESLSLKLDNRVDMDAKSRMSILRNNWAKHTTDVPYVIGANITESKNDTCGKILLVISWFFIILFFPLLSKKH